MKQATILNNPNSQWDMGNDRDGFLKNLLKTINEHPGEPNGDMREAHTMLTVYHLLQINSAHCERIFSLVDGLQKIPVPRQTRVRGP